MSAVHTSIVKPKHEYTRQKSPWILDKSETVYGKLMHYLSGGGLRSFGRTIRQERVRHRHFRFYVWCGVLGFLWLLFYFF